MHPRVIKQKLQYALKHHLLPLLLQKFAQGGMLNQICSLTISGIEAFSESNIHVFVIGRCCTANDLTYDMHVMVFCQHKTILFKKEVALGLLLLIHQYGGSVILIYCLYLLSILWQHKIPDKPKKPSRYHKRRPKNLTAEFTRRQRRVRWLETHIWHAKRYVLYCT